jgi:hypothetical protein
MPVDPCNFPDTSILRGTTQPNAASAPWLTAGYVEGKLLAGARIRAPAGADSH